jgi:excisionase family DNA binding protein
MSDNKKADTGSASKNAQKIGRGPIVRRPAHDAREQSRPGRLTPPRRSREPLRFFTVAEIAEVLGVSTRSIRRWIENCELVVHRFGRGVRISESDLKAFLAIHRDG